MDLDKIKRIAEEYREELVIDLASKLATYIDDDMLEELDIINTTTLELRELDIINTTTLEVRWNIKIREYGGIILYKTLEGVYMQIEYDDEDEEDIWFTANYTGESKSCLLKLSGHRDAVRRIRQENTGRIANTIKGVLGE